MKKHTTKHALFMSMLSLLLCVSMLAGTTFAWFTDSVTSANNIIKAGNLDVELEYAKVVDGAMTAWQQVEGADRIFDPDALWEPGRVEVVYLKVSNLGTLALKYQLGVNIVKETPGINVAGDKLYLSDHLVFKTIEMPDQLTTFTDREAVAAAAGTEKGLKDYNGKTTALDPKGSANDEDYVALVVYMPETVSNEANYRAETAPTIELGVNLFATQFASENDSLGNDYDKNAWTDKMKVHTADDLFTAASYGGEVVLYDDIVLHEKTTSSSITMLIENELTIDLNGHTISSPDVVFYVLDGGKLTINGNGNVISGDGGSGHCVTVYAYGGEVVINGGTYSINKQFATDHAADMIYAANGGKITINGGTFKHVENVWTLNLKDNSNSSIEVKGGTFEGFNPADNVSEGANTSFVAEGFVSAEENGVYTVKMTGNSLKDLLTAEVNSGKTEIEIDANNSTIDMAKASLVTKALVPAGTTVTVKNATITGSSKNNKADGTLIFENCTFTHTGAYSIHFDGGVADVIFNNCVLEGWCVFGAPLNSVTMNNCTLNGNGRYAMFRFYENAVLNNCTIDASNSDHTDSYNDGVSSFNPNINGTDKTITVELVNCNIVNAEFECLKENASLLGTIKIDGVPVVTTSEGFDAALNNGEDSITLYSGSYELPTNLSNVSLTAEGEVTVAVSTDNTVYLGENVTVKGINFVNDQKNANGVLRVTGENVVIEGCTFDLVSGSYGVAVTNGSSATIKDCTFTGGRECIGHISGNNYSLTIDNCTFKDAGSVYGIHVNAVGGDIIIKNSTIGLFNTFFGYQDETRNTGTLRFENCDFVYVAGKTNVVKLYRDAEFVNCDFEDGFLLSAGYDNQDADWTFSGGSWGEGSIKNYLLNDTFGCGVTATFDNEVWNFDNTTQTWTQQ